MVLQDVEHFEVLYPQLFQYRNASISRDSPSDLWILDDSGKAIMIELRLVPHESSIVFNLNSFLGWATYNEHDQRAAISRTQIVQASFCCDGSMAWMVFVLVVFLDRVLLHQMFW